MGLIPATWLSFGPVAAFHHMIAFGVSSYLVLNGEFASPGDHMWGEYSVRFFPLRFAAGLALWLLSVFFIFKGVRFLSDRRYLP